MLHFKEKIYQICGCIAGILFAIFGFINAAGLRGTGLEKILYHLFQRGIRLHNFAFAISRF